MHFTLKQLRYVDAALRTGSIVQAAREMNISQSSIAAAIDASEALMGVPLFHRMPAKGIVPTDEGLLAASKIRMTKRLSRSAPRHSTRLVRVGLPPLRQLVPLPIPACHPGSKTRLPKATGPS